MRAMSRIASRHGMLLLALAIAVLTAGEPPPQPRRPARTWEADIAALTDDRAAINTPAMERLGAAGAGALPDLAVLASDANWRVRGRVVSVAASIGAGLPADSVGAATATALMLRLSQDREPGVRALAAVALGTCPRAAAGVFERLGDLLVAPEPEVRAAAARGLVRFGDPRGLDLLTTWGGERDPAARAALRASLADHARQPASVPAVVVLLGKVRGPALSALIEACAPTVDPRLSPALAAVVASGEPRAALAAARALEINGDSRAVEALCVAAASHADPGVREAAGAALRALTGHPAAAGPAWTLWWRDHAAEIARLAARDQLIAALYDPARAVDRAELATFAPRQLWALIEGCLGAGAVWWPARSAQVLLQDDAARWTSPLAEAITAETDADRRLGLILVLDQLGDPGAAAVLQTQLDKVEVAEAAHAKAARAKGKDGPRSNAERAALAAAIARRERAR